MTSINFNASATTALRTLQATNSALETTQNRVSTGLKIGEAKDNAAYWSISTTLQSDNKALSTVKDALNLGAATVDTAYQGLNKAKEVLDEIKSKLTAATAAGVDKTKIQAEIDQLKEQLVSIAGSSSFSGENWLNEAGGEKEIVSSFTRDAANNISIGTITIDTDDVALFAAGAGILDTVEGYSVNSFEVSTGFDVSTDIALIAEDSLTFTVAQPSAAVLVTVNKDIIDSALGGTAGTIATGADLVAVMNKALTAAGVTGVTASMNEDSSELVFSSDSAFTIGSVTVEDGATPNTPFTAANLGMVNEVASAPDDMDMSVENVSIDADSTKAEIEAMIAAVSAATDKVITQASNLGAVSSRIELQNSFVDTLIDTIDKGVSDLVDADLSEESTRLQALQTKQQLGIQALSIANASTQNVLSLFQ